MKRFTSMILCLLLLFCGCSNEQTSGTATTTPYTETTTPTTQPTIPAVETVPYTKYQAPLIAASTALITQDFGSSDGTTVLQYTCQDLVLSLDDPQVADAIGIDFLNLVDSSKVHAEAQRAYENANDWSAYVFKRIYNPMRLDSSVLSMYGSQTLSTDNSHATTAGISVTYDLFTGQRLSLKQILKADFSADTLAMAITKALTPLADEGILYSDHAYVITEMFSTNTPVDCWYLSDNGLCFYFAPYEIAPYSAGIIVAEIPYDQLTDILKDEYFPSEEIELSGTLLVTDFASADLNSYTQFAELPLDSHADEYLIHVAGAVSNFRVLWGTWQADGSFVSEATLFASSTLCDGDALRLQIDGSKIGNICITYESGGKLVSVSLNDLLAKP